MKRLSEGGLARQTRSAAISLDECRELMLMVYASVIGEGGAIYCSAPVTSGERYLEWLQRRGKIFANVDEAVAADRESHAAQVIQPNRLHAQEVVASLRRRTGRVVIDPTALPHLNGWTQHDWRLFWRDVIERYASKVVFVDGWQYSNGCAYEFWVAHNYGLPTYREHGQLLSLSEGHAMVLQASISIRNLGLPSTHLDEVSGALAQLRESAYDRRIDHTESTPFGE